MAEWTPFIPNSRGDAIRTETVRVMRTGLISVSADLMQRLGTPAHVSLLTNGTGDKVGIRATQQGEVRGAYRVGGNGRAGSLIHGYAVLARLGRQPSRHGPVEVPYSWDGDVLVIDVSGLPEVKAGAR